MFLEDTIGAIATPPGIGGVGIIRVSGKKAFSTVDSLFESTSDTPLVERPNRTIQYGFIYKEDRPVDEVLLLLMKGPHSYTGEDVVEIQCHGGIVPLRTIMELLIHKGVRLAEPGEFTKRAFLNGRIDLTQAEAIIDIIEAKSEQGLQLAMHQLEGSLSQEISAIRSHLLDLIAHLEVTIDYPEEDIEEVSIQEVSHQLEPIEEEVDHLLNTAQRGRLIREGLQTVLIGLPNAGKSSLMNRLLREERAIVTDIPGTTRDSIEEYLILDGIMVRLIDTAGIRKTSDVVERIGVDRTYELMDKADMVLCLIDGSAPISEEEVSLLKGALEACPQGTVVLLNKCDQPQVVTPDDIRALEESLGGTFLGVAPISAQENLHIDVIGQYIRDFVYDGTYEGTYEKTLANVRHIGLMEEAWASLESARQAMDGRLPIDCVVTDLRAAWEAMGEITGEAVGEELTKELFSRFCLGK